MLRDEAAGAMPGFIAGPGGSGGRVAVSTHDRGEAAVILRRAYPRLRFDLGCADGPFVLRHSVVGDGRLSSTELVLAGRARASGTHPDGVVAVGEVLGGRLSLEPARSGVDPARPFLRPPGPARMTSEDLHLRTTELDEPAFRAAAERYGRQGAPLRPGPGGAPSPSACAAWAWTASHIQRAARDPRVLDNPIVAGELFDLAVRTLLACFGDPDEDRGAVALDAPRSLRRAVGYLEEHALEPIAIPDVAAAARISVRSLQALFRRHLGVSPVEHLHAIRLEGARKELLRGTGGDCGSVRAVAERWGFGNSGRFARLYRARFGERPSETLRGRR